MRKIAPLMFDMLTLQERLNEIIDKDWINKRTLDDLYIAIFQEVSELIDTYPWKWWKHMEDDIDHRKLELIDIWHFIMSYWILLYKKKNVQIELKFISQNLVNYYVNSTKPITPLTVVDITDIAYHFKPGNNTTLGTASYFRVIKSVFEDFNEFTKLYYAKNILNIVRQQQGYKKGTYLKIKNGIEDNQRLMDVVKKINKFENFEDFQSQIFQYFINQKDKEQ